MAGSNIIVKPTNEAADDAQPCGASDRPTAALSATVGRPLTYTLACQKLTPREITSLMNRLFYGSESGGSDPWRHLLDSDGNLDRVTCTQLLTDYVPESEVLVFVDSRHAVHCSIEEAAAYIDEFMKIRRVKISNLSFTSKVVVDTIGVGQGNSRANPSFHRTASGGR